MGKRYKTAELEEPISKRAIHLLLLVLTTSIMFFAAAGRIPLMDPDEARYVSISKHMVDSSNYLDPILYGKVYYDKPPLYFWLIAASIKVFGYSELSVRLISIISAILMLLSTYCLASELFDHKLGLLSAVILTTTPITIGFAKYIRMDLLLVAELYFAIWAFIRGYLTDQPKWYYLMYAFLGLSLLTKGLIGILIAAATIFIFMCWQKDFSLIFKVNPIAGLAIIIAIAGPWFLYMFLKYPDYFRVFFIDHHFSRFSSDEFKHAQSPFIYLATILLGLLPWTVFSILGYCRYLKAALDIDKKDLASRFLVIVPAFVVIFFSLGRTKLINYILPAFPALSILTARLFYDYYNSSYPERKKQKSFSLIYPVSYLLAICIGTLWIIAAISMPFIYNFFRWHGLQSPYNWWIWVALIYKIAIAIFLIKILIYLWRNWMLLELLGISITAIFFLSLDLSYTVFPRIANAFSCKPLIPIITANSSEDDIIPFGPHKRWSLPLYLSGRRQCRLIEKFELLDTSIISQRPQVLLVTKDNWYEKLKEKYGDKIKVLARFKRTRLIYMIYNDKDDLSNILTIDNTRKNENTK